MRVAVLGATGVLGQPVVLRLLERGHHVRAVVARSALTLEPRQGLDVLHGNILDADSLLAPLDDCDAVLHLATAIPKPGGAADWSLNDRIRREGTRNLLWAAQRGGRPRYIQQSVAMLHAGPRDALADEDSPVCGSPMLDSALDMEQSVRASALPWVILRGGLFYGPRTGRTQETDRLAREGRLSVPGQGHDYVSLVRPEDLAEAVVLAVESDLSGDVLNIVDDCPVTWSQLLQYVAAQHGARSAAEGGPVTLPSFRVSNARAKQRLAWRPRFPDYRTGWTAP